MEKFMGREEKEKKEKGGYGERLREITAVLKNMPLPGVFLLRSSGSYWKIWAQLILSWVRSCLFVPIFCRNATVTS